MKPDKQKPPRLSGTAFCPMEKNVIYFFTCCKNKEPPANMQAALKHHNHKNTMKKKLNNNHSLQRYAITGERCGIDFQFVPDGNPGATM